MNSVLPKVSVVTITYGHEKYITETLDGVLMQQYQGPVEFIIANDNSPDATDEVVKKYFSENPAPENFEIKYTKHDTNKGMMPNFIWALEQATGEYIALCEGDDYWIDPLKLQKQVDFLESNPNYVMNSCQSKEINIENNNTRIINWHTQSFVFKNILKEDYLKKHPKEIINCDTFLRIYLEEFGKTMLLGFIGGVYRITGKGIWTSIETEKRYCIAQCSHHAMLKFFKEHNYKKSYIKVKKSGFDLNLNNYKGRDEVSTFDFLNLLWQVIVIRDFARFKSLIVTLPFIRKLRSK